MADKIASLIMAHSMYIAATRVLQNDIVKAANSVGYPTDDAFITHMNDFKRNDHFIYSKMQNMTSSFDTLTNKAEQLAQESRSSKRAAGGVVKLLEIGQIHERVNQEVDHILEAMMAKAEARADEVRARNSGVAAARGAGEPSNAESSTLMSPAEGNTGMAPPSGPGDHRSS